MERGGVQAGWIEGGRHVLPLRVYYEDTDFSGVVYHANYLRFFERGRTEFIRALGIDQRALHDTEKIAFVVRSMRVDFLKPALMDDLVTVETSAIEMRGPALKLSQNLMRDTAILTTAEVLVVCLRTGRPCRLPEALRTAIEAAAQ
jgi:acyl-CoA thioester hydrolase